MTGLGWQLRSEYKTPGQALSICSLFWPLPREVTNLPSLQPFEDGMEVNVPAVVTLKMVKEKLDERRRAAKQRAAAVSQPPRGLLPPPHWPPPHGYPPVWGGPGAERDPHVNLRNGRTWKAFLGAIWPRLVQSE